MLAARQRDAPIQWGRDPKGHPDQADLQSAAQTKKLVVRPEILRTYTPMIL